MIHWEAREAAKRVLERCDLLGALSESPDSLCRTFLSPPMREVHKLLLEWMREAGLTAHLDAVGNVRGRLEGIRSSTLVVGSHVDTVPDAGKYDGVLGVLLGIEIARVASQTRPHHSLEVIAFSEEEGVRFGFPFIGSSAVSGSFDPAWLTKVDAAGITLEKSLVQFGLDPLEIPGACIPSSKLLSYFEIHIEQGPVLESLDAPLGVVTGLVGQSRHTLEFSGRAAHAGTTPMNLRRDPLPAAAEFVLEVERLAQNTEGLTATVGRLETVPGAGNVIAGIVKLSLDVRHASDVVRLLSVSKLLESSRHIADTRGLKCSITQDLEQNAVPCDPAQSSRLVGAVLHGGLTVHRLPSGAGHDAMTFAPLCPVTMLFIRSPGGISHNPLESVLESDVENALEVGATFVCDILEDASA